MTAGLKAAIFAVSGLGVDDLAAVFTLDSAHTGVTINEIFHQNILIFTFPLFRCHRHPPLAVTGVWWIMKSIICQKCYGSVAVIKMVTGHFCTIKRYDCLVGDQNDHQLKSVRYGWVVSEYFVHLPLPSGELRFS